MASNPTPPLSAAAPTPPSRPQVNTGAKRASSGTGSGGETDVRSDAGAASDFISTYIRSDILLAVGVVTIILFMLIPMPSFMLDAGLSVSITFSICILMMVLFIKSPLEFSTFPTVLLIATSLRLGLNVASTRLILENGHEGRDAAGQIIEAFGGLIIQGSYVIGGIVFAILVIVNFVVITKGSGRIAEVAARFSLDAMPGKQMAIDSDMSAGLITEEEAKKRRSDLEAESTFFGSMDGAAKFVRGDAIAGIMIVFVNIVGGIVVGTMMQGLTLAEAANNYTILTIGDGLVSQIPALIVSVSAGFLVSRSGIKGSANQALANQFTKYPMALGASGALMILLGLIPGIPFVPFFVLAAITGGMAFVGFKKQNAPQEEAADKPKTTEITDEESVNKALAIDAIRLELGYGLLSLVKEQEGDEGQDSGKKLPTQIKGLRRQLAEEMGYILPAVRIQDNLRLPAQTYVVKMKEVEVARGDIRPGMFLCMDPRGGTISLAGEATIEPTFGLPALWISPSTREDALAAGYTVVDTPTVVTTHLTEVIRDSMADLLSYAEVQKLLDAAPDGYAKLVGDLVPAQITIGGIQRILQNLLSERLSIRDLPTILEGISEAAAYTKNPSVITEHVRTRLSRQICESYKDEAGVVALLTLSPDWEEAFGKSIVGQGDDRQLAMAPSKLQEFIVSVRKSYEEIEAGTISGGKDPVMLTSPAIRPFVRSVVERFRPQTAILSQNEIHPKAKIRTVGSVE